MSGSSGYSRAVQAEELAKELFGDGTVEGFVMRVVLKGVSRPLAELLTCQFKQVNGYFL